MTSPLLTIAEVAELLRDMRAEIRELRDMAVVADLHPVRNRAVVDLPAQAGRDDDATGIRSRNFNLRPLPAVTDAGPKPAALGLVDHPPESLEKCFSASWPGDWLVVIRI